VPRQTDPRQRQAGLQAALDGDTAIDHAGAIGQRVNGNAQSGGGGSHMIGQA